MIEASRDRRNHNPTPLENGADILLNASDLPSKEEIDFKEVIEAAYKAVSGEASRSETKTSPETDYVDMSRNAGVLIMYNREAEGELANRRAA